MEKEVSQEYQVSTIKRVSVFFLDALMSIIIFIALLFLATTPILNKVGAKDIETMNSVYKTTCEKYDYPCRNDESLYGLYTFDKEAYVQYLIDEKIETDQNKAYDKCNEELKKLNKELQENETYLEAYRDFKVKYVTSTAMTMFIPLFIFHLIIPLFTKNKQTLMMLAFHLVPVNKNTNTIISNIKVFLRFLVIFLIEALLVWMLLDMIGLIFVLFGSFAIMVLTKRCVSIHDAITGINLIDKAYILNK